MRTESRRSCAAVSWTEELRQSAFFPPAHRPDRLPAGPNSRCRRADGGSSAGWPARSIRAFSNARRGRSPSGLARSPLAGLLPVPVGRSIPRSGLAVRGAERIRGLLAGAGRRLLGAVGLSERRPRRWEASGEPAVGARVTAVPVFPPARYEGDDHHERCSSADADGDPSPHREATGLAVLFLG